MVTQSRIGRVRSLLCILSNMTRSFCIFVFFFLLFFNWRSLVKPWVAGVVLGGISSNRFRCNQLWLMVRLVFDQVPLTESHAWNLQKNVQCKYVSLNTSVWIPMSCSGAAMTPDLWVSLLSVSSLSHEQHKIFACCAKKRRSCLWRMSPCLQTALRRR